MKAEIPIKGSTKKAQFSMSVDGRVKHVIWQPGNGSRYFITFLFFDDDAGAFEGAPKNYALVLHGTPGMQIRAYPFTTHTHKTVAWTYVQQKLTSNMVDASELARVIGTVLERPVMLCTRDEDGEYAGDGNTIDHD